MPQRHLKHMPEQKKSYEKLLLMALHTKLTFYIINANSKQTSQKSRLIL